MADGPTHWTCIRHQATGALRGSSYQEHCDREHEGRIITVVLSDRRCPHGNPLEEGFMFCCDYEP